MPRLSQHVVMAGMESQIYRQIAAEQQGGNNQNRLRSVLFRPAGLVAAPRAPAVQPQAHPVQAPSGQKDQGRQ